MKPWRSLGDFSGGVPLATQKSLSSESPIRSAGLPPHLLYPLDLAAGYQAVPVVGEGDYVRSGSLLAVDPDNIDPPIYATSSGTIFLGEGPRPTPSTPLSPLIGIKTDGLDLKEPPLPVLEGKDLTPSNVLQRLQRAGVLGMGGAGFPTAEKIKGLRGPLKLFIINGAECEPFLTCDERVIREQTIELLNAAELLARIFDIPRILVAVETSRVMATQSLEQALAGGAFPRSALFSLQDRYPAGGERQVIQAVSGLQISGGNHPVDHGILCLNVQTVLAAARSILKGERLTQRTVTVSGSGIMVPSNLDVLIGTPTDYLLKICGGVRDGCQHLILGGPMMGFSIPNDQVPITKTISALLVLSDRDLGLQKFGYEHPCIRCSACTEACPQGLLPQSLHDHVRAKRVAELEHLHLLDCIECGCCDVVCPSFIPLTERFRAGKKSLRRYLADEQLARKAQQRHAARLARLTRDQMERENEAIQRKTALGQSAQPRIQEALERAKLKRDQRLNVTQNADVEHEP